MCIFAFMPISRRQRDMERLAWAGGFFDGEGSTMARAETSRPEYRRLNISVHQRGDAVAPEVLLRFAAAMNGMGAITRPYEGIYKWRVSDHAQAIATIQLLRPWLGAVKRRQAARAIRAVGGKRTASGIRGRRPDEAIGSR